MATPLLQQRLFEDALRVIEAGIEAIREFLDEYNQSHRAEECGELVSLERWREEILGREERAAPPGRKVPSRFSASSWNGRLRPRTKAGKRRQTSGRCGA